MKRIEKIAQVKLVKLLKLPAIKGGVKLTKPYKLLKATKRPKALTSAVS